MMSTHGIHVRLSWPQAREFTHSLFSETSVWTKHQTQGHIPPPTRGHVAFAVGRHLYVLGGETPGGPQRQVYALDTGTFRIDGRLLWPVLLATQRTLHGTTCLLSAMYCAPASVTPCATTPTSTSPSSQAAALNLSVSRSPHSRPLLVRLRSSSRRRSCRNQRMQRSLAPPRSYK